jgi:hypothetical protein
MPRTRSLAEASEMAALCRCRQRAAVEDVHKQLEVGQVKAHGIRQGLYEVWI